MYELLELKDVVEKVNEALEARGSGERLCLRSAAVDSDLYFLRMRDSAGKVTDVLYTGTVSSLIIYIAGFIRGMKGVE